jgi:hypothetical protein
MSDIDPLEPPKKDARDTNYQLKAATLSVFPLLKEFYELVIEPPFQQRTTIWMNTVAKRCREYEKKFNGFIPENLVKNEVFQSAFAASARIAVQTHQKEKLEALCNALLNTVIMKDLDENFKLLFFAYIESMTVLHMDIIKFFRQLREGEGALDKMYVPYFELYKGEREVDVNLDEILFTSLCKDLENKGLLLRGKKLDAGGGLRKSPTGHFQWIRHTALGERFYNFIIEPSVEEKKS